MRNSILRYRQRDIRSTQHIKAAASLGLCHSPKNFDNAKDRVQLLQDGNKKRISAKTSIKNLKSIDGRIGAKMLRRRKDGCIMFNFKMEAPHMKRGGTEISKKHNASNVLLEVILSVALAVFPSGIAAIAAEMGGETNSSGEPTNNMLRTTSNINGCLSFNPGKLKLKSKNTYYWPNFTIGTENISRLIYSATIQFTSAISDSDEINVTTNGNFKILNTNKHGNKTVNNTQGATTTEWQEYLRNCLTVQLANVNKTADIRITLSYAQTERTVEYFAGTGHYYELVSSSHPVTWNDALNGASQKRYMGRKGYLVTIMSAQENQFIASLINAATWLGGTCHNDYIKQWSNIASSKQKYYWVTGPEAGTQIPTWQYSVPGGYSLWNINEDGQTEPNNPTAEFFMHMYSDNSKWNNYANNNKKATAYIVEYGGMPGDETDTTQNATIDIALDPKGQTLSVNLENNRIEFGSALSIIANVNGEVIPSDKVTHTFYIEDASQPDGWRELDASELGANGTPVHAGNYKVESNATYTDDDGDEQSYIPGSAEFTIAPKTIDLTGGDRVVITKTYDGTTDFDLSDIDLSGSLIGDADVKLEASSIGGVGSASAGDKALTLNGVTLSGKDASDYKLSGLGGDGSLSVKAQILPRRLVVTTDANIKKGYANSALKAPDGRGLELGSNLAVRDADAGGAWLENELAPCDGEIGEGGVLSTILGEETLAAVNEEGNQLDPNHPQKGTYKVGAHYANVNPMDGDGGATGAVARMSDPSDTPVAAAPASERLPNATETDDLTYDIGNYILTIRPATIIITPRGGGAGGSGSGPDAGNPDTENPGVTFAPIGADTEIRLDPSAAGTVGGDPYFEYDPDRPVNILDVIQVKPNDGGDWSNWVSGPGSSTGPGNPDNPGSSGGSDNPSGSNPSNPDGSGPTNPDSSTNPGGPADGGGSGDGGSNTGSGNDNGTGDPDDPNDPANPDGSFDGTGSGNGNDDGSGSGSGDSSTQLPDNVKVTVTDEAGRPVDPTNITEPGTYDVTISVKDSETDQFVVVDTLTFHVVDTSVTDTDYIYKDVHRDHWGHGYIFDIGPKVINGCFNPSDVALGYMGGYAGTTDFGPGNGIIRGDTAIVIWRMAGCPDVEADGNGQSSPKLLSLANTYYTGFSDCDAAPEMYYNKAISWCAANGIVEGYGDTGEYRPQNPITREEFASIIARYASFRGKDTSAYADLSQYPDIQDVSDWALPNMRYVVASGIMTGKGTDEGTADGTHGILDPQADITRAEVAKMAYMEQPSKL